MRGKLIVAALLAAAAGGGGTLAAQEIMRGEEINECQVIAEGGRPRYHAGEVVEREYWQTFSCADGYEFTQVWPESTIRSTFGNALREDS